MINSIDDYLFQLKDTLGGSDPAIIHDALSDDVRGELVTLDTDEERTLFFDFFPLELGTISGYQVRFNMYTIPGQIYYEASRRLMLDGADGVGSVSIPIRVYNPAAPAAALALRLPEAVTVYFEGIPIPITRLYDTANVGQDGDFGDGWTLDLGRDVVHTDDSNYHDGKLVHDWPTGTGKRGLETYSGTYVVLGKAKEVVMDSCSARITCDKENPEYYSMKQYWATRITASGTFLHAAGWDPVIGKANVSHGCVHLADAHAKEYFDRAEIGDVVIVSNTGRGPQERIATQDPGLYDWNLSWEQWTAGSALK